MKKIGLINGPNLNLLGEREPDIYGTTTLADIEQELQEMCRHRTAELVCYQTNSEGEMIDILHRLGKETDCILLNPGGYTHTSIAVKDAIAGIGTPVIEVHISNIFNREHYRQISVTGSSCAGVITGFGIRSYRLALEAALSI